MTATPVWWDSFDMYNGLQGNIGLLSRWRATSTNLLTHSEAGGLTGGRYGGQALYLTNDFGGAGPGAFFNWTDVIFDPTATLAHMTVFCAINRNVITSDSAFLTLKDQNMNPQVSMGIDISGRFWAAQGRNGARYYTASLQATTAAIWNGVAIEVVIAGGSSGLVNLWANGVNLGGVSGINTNPTGQNNACVLEFGTQPTTVSMTQIFDDVHITNGTYLDECRNEIVYPVADILAGWVPDSGASNSARVKELQVDGDASYVATATSGARDLYSIGSLSSNPYNIYGANVVSFGYKTDATTRQFYNSIRSGVTDSDGPAFNMAGNYRRFDRPILLNPNTGLPWTAADINNLKIGPKMV